MTLTEFLLARIAEDERTAAESSARYAEITGGASWSLPTRVLAECEAKRRIVAELDDWQREEAVGIALAMKHLALPYAEHPDCREEWKS